MQFELKSKTFYRKTLFLMAPIVLQQTINFGVNFLDNVMMGSFGEVHIAAVSFGNQFYSLFQFICMGLGSGAVVLSSQFWGGKKLSPMKTVAAISLRLTLAICLLFTLVSLMLPEIIMRIFTNEASVIAVGTPYVRLIGFTFILSGLSSTITYLLRSTGNTLIPFIGSAGAFVLNLFFNWVFIFGELGAPQLEIVGAAVGTIIARVFEFCLVFGYFIFKDKNFHFRLPDFKLPGSQLYKQYFKYSIPVLVSDTLLGASLLIVSIITGHMGEEMAASSSIVNSVVQITNVLNMGMAGAAAIVVGNTIGTGDIPKAKREGNSYMLLSLLYGFFMIGVLLLLETPYMNLYNVSEETARMVHGMFLVNCAWLPIQANAYATSKGILRGSGDTRFLMFIDSSAVWLVSIPLGALAGFVWNLSPVWVYLLLRLEYPLKGIICFIRYCTGKWINTITSSDLNKPSVHN